MHAVAKPADCGAMQTRGSDAPIIQELSGERYPSLDSAHEAGVPILAQLLANAIQAGLDTGRYIVDNGVVKLSEETRGHEGLPAAGRQPRLGLLP
jgi:hypothetical protein